MKDSYWFAHDSNARSDPKMLCLIAKYGHEGYGMYWVIIEILREQKDYRLINNNMLIKIISIALSMREKKVEKFLNDLISLKLLEKDENYLFSPSLIRRMEVFDRAKQNRIEKARKAAIARHSENANDA